MQYGKSRFHKIFAFKVYKYKLDVQSTSKEILDKLNTLTMFPYLILCAIIS